MPFLAGHIARRILSGGAGIRLESPADVLAQVQSAAVVGIDALPVSVEADVAFGLPVFAMVGLPDASVRESRDRVRAAIRNSGFDFPAHRITVNPSPADVRKAGSAFDLPIAGAILAASGALTRPRASAGRRQRGPVRRRAGPCRSRPACIGSAFRC